jgi:hypothetical protein
VSQDPTEDPALYWRQVAYNVLLQRSELRPSDRVLDLSPDEDIAGILQEHVQSVRRAPPTQEVRNQPTLVTAAFALSCLDQPGRLEAFQRLHRALPEGGLLVIADWFWSIPFSDIEGIEGWFEPERTPSAPATQVMQELEQRGWRVVLEPLHPALSVLTALRL